MGVESDENGEDEGCGEWAEEEESDSEESDPTHDPWPNQKLPMRQVTVTHTQDLVRHVVERGVGVEERVEERGQLHHHNTH